MRELATYNDVKQGEIPMTPELKNLIEDQINKELYSAYLYFDIAEFYRAKGLKGFHVWFEKQAQEEIEHAERFAEYLHDLAVPFVLKPIAAPDNHFESIREPLVLQVTHEKYVTSLIHAIARQAEKDGDVGTVDFLSWYIAEQREEEEKASALLTRYDLFADGDKVGLYHLDKDLAAERK